MPHVTRAQVRQLVGHEIIALRQNGSVVHGRLTGLKGDKLMLAPIDGKAYTQAILPLALFDILAISTSPFAGFGGFDGGFGFGGGLGFGGFGFPGFI